MRRRVAGIPSNKVGTGPSFRRSTGPAAATRLERSPLSNMGGNVGVNVPWATPADADHVVPLDIDRSHDSCAVVNVSDSETSRFRNLARPAYGIDARSTPPATRT